MGRRRQAREAALQALYLCEMGKMSAREAMQSVLAGSTLDDVSAAFAHDLAVGAQTHREALDERIRPIAANWSLERMTAVDRNILRLASYELLHCPQTPIGVIIDEALEIAKIYSSTDSSRFINGILDKIRLARDEAKAEDEGNA